MATRIRAASTGVEVRFLSALVAAIGCCLVAVNAQIPGPNVNMVAGQALPGGDPFLQRQNEPSVAVSTRNPLHLLAGANDYRTVDLPGLPNGEVTGDAWLGVFKSTDGGNTWTSTLLPGYPQDPAHSPPLFGYQAAADPMVRAGSNGLFYYSGIVFERAGGTPNAVFVARFIDNNNKENGDPIAFAGTRIVASNSGTAFIDKPALAVDIPRGKGTCTIQTPGPNNTTLTQSVPAGNVYVTYTVGTGDEDDFDTFQSQIFFTASADCGVTWSPPVQISQAGDRINQGASLAINPANGSVHIAWRRFSADGLSDGIVTTRSTNSGQTFSSPDQVRHFPRGATRTVGDLRTFDQPTLLNESPLGPQFRTNGYPSLTVDGNGRLYVAWTERGFATSAPDPAAGDSRVVVATAGAGGGAWSTPQPVDNPTGRGHQIMPALTFAEGKLLVVYYDLREDISLAFQQYIRDYSGIPLRHTIDVRTAQALPGANPVFDPSVRVSQYIFGEPAGATTGKVQLQFNVPNLPLFRLGTAPFFSDYLDVAALAMVPGKNGWEFNSAKSAAPVFHAAWTDNRDVRPPLDLDWRNYTPPNSAYRTSVGPMSVFDPGVFAPGCQAGQAGMRNQNIYGARITAGLLVAAPGNAKQLSPTLQRAFVVFAQNTTDVIKTFRLTIAGQPPGGRASFSQFPIPPYTNASPPPLVSIDAQIEPRSSISRTVFVTSSDPKAQVGVDVVEINGLGGGGVPSGLAGSVLLNPDVSNPDVSNPDVSNPVIVNPDVSNAEVFTPDVSNPDVSNPDVSNPAILNPDVSNPDVSNVLVLNPDVSNPDVSNPDVSNPDVSNPDVSNPDVSNPDVSNASLTDVSWTVTNNGNTTTAFSIKLVLNQNTVPAGIITQLLLYRQYRTPVADACDLKFSTQNVLIANIPNPVFTAPGNVTQLNPTDGSLKNATMYLQPFEKARITIRVLDPNKNDTITFNPKDDVVPVVVSQGVDSPKAAVGGTTPDVAIPPSSGLPFFVTTTADSGPGSLRKAIQDNEASSGGSHIVFNIPGGGPYVITPASPFPVMTKPIVVDGTTQPGWAGAPIVQIDGSAAGPGAIGFALTGGSSGIRGLVIRSFGGPGIQMTTLGSNQILGNYIGTDVSGSVGAGNTSSGVAIVNSSGSRVGGTAFGEGNVISSNGNGGIRIEDSSGTIVQGNLIGTNASGTATLGNLGNGVLMTVSGGTVSNTLIDANTISGNAICGVYSDQQTNLTVTGNRIGTNAAGTAAIANACGVFLHGVATSVVGGVASSARNIIGGHSGGAAAIWIYADSASADNNQIIGNYLGVGADGTTPILNGVGVVITAAGGAASNNQVGGSLPGSGNVISGNSVGVLIEGALATSNIVQRNLVGVDVTGGLAVPNGDGVKLQSNTSGNLIGGVTAGLGNVISGNTNGIKTLNSSSNVIVGNQIGTDMAGTSAIGNLADGILLLGGASNTIGGATAGERNIVSGNSIGIEMFADSNLVVGNYVGTNAAGTGAVANSCGGVRMDGSNNTLGGANAGERNVISGNGAACGLNGFGVYLGSAATLTNWVYGNYIGVDANGAALGNQTHGVVVTGSNIAVGGPAAGQGNVISNNIFNGVIISGGGASNIAVPGNKIGTDPTGTVAMGNVGNGVLVTAGAHDVAVGNAVTGSVISANTEYGVMLDNVSDVAINNDYIGTNSAGASLGNGLAGVAVYNGTTDVAIGGVTGGDVIAFNGAQGIVVSGAGGPDPQRIAIHQNSIYANTGIGIDLNNDGVTANDGLDADGGPNGLQNYPQITSATTVSVSGELFSAPSQTYTIRVFVSDTSNIEGKTFVTSTTVVTDAAGHAFVGPLPVSLTSGKWVTATAMDAVGNSSEFSTPIQVP